MGVFLYNFCMNYQQLRMEIPFTITLNEFNDLLKLAKLSKDQRLGIVREWRAFWYLRTRFAWANTLFVSDLHNDHNGVDFIGQRHGKKVTIQVGGYYKKEYVTDYYLMVTDTKIYIYSNK